MKSKKWVKNYVLDSKICWDVVWLFCLLPSLAMILNNISNTLIVMRKAIEKIFRAVEVWLLIWKTLLLNKILSFLLWFYLQNEHETSKNGSEITFWTLKISWNIVWLFCLLPRLAMILNSISNTLVVKRKAIEKFSEQLKWRR